MGQWDKALAGYAKAFEAELPKDADLWLEYACLLVQQGDLDTYRQLCAGLLEGFGQSKEEGELHLLAQACSLAPQSLHHAGRIIGLATQQMAMAHRRGALCGWECHVLGLAYYRAGQYQQAGNSLKEFLKAHPDDCSYIANWLLMGMIEHRLGHAEKAQGWLDKAELWIKEETPKMVQLEDLSAERGHPWRDWLMIQLLHREAETLIRGKTTDRSRPKKTEKPPGQPGE
jgi:tetratricopeptide (TPR) repeat protein